MNNVKNRLDEKFCEGCCYNNNPNPQYNCKKIVCCFLVRNECILHEEGYVFYKELID